MTDRRTYLAVIIVLGVVLVLCVVAIAGLAGYDRDIPGILENLAVGSLTGLAGLLSRGPSSEPQNVNVVNRPNDPVPVDAGAGELRLIAIFAVATVAGLLLYRLIVANCC